jgi:catechol-2,3-dioxygenase
LTVTAAIMGSAPVPDFDNVGEKVLSPSTLAHVVLRTGNFSKMVDFYTSFLGGTVTHGNDFLSFITYDEEHHRIALIGVPGTGPKIPTSSGLEHVAFTFPTVSALLLAYRQRKARGILPIWCVNHGPTTSIYYKDPDGNMLETQVDNFETVEAANDFMKSKAFAENPIGTDFDAEDFIARIKRGEAEETLKKRVEIGSRALPDDLF